MAGNREPAPGTPDAQTTVVLTNTAPLLTFPSDATVDENSTFQTTCLAADTESPPQVLTYSLVQGPPGMVMDPQTGLITWATGEAHGDSVNQVTVCVSDNGLPPLSDCKSFTVLVRDINSPPSVCPQPLVAVSVGDQLSITNCAFDPDIPKQNLTFSLGWVSDTNATINPTNGIFRWRPSVAFPSTTNWFEVVATDDGNPHLSATQLVTVLVNDYLALGLGSTVMQIEQNGGVALGVFSSAGVSELESLLCVTSGYLTNFGITPLGANICSVTVQPAPPCGYRLRAVTCSGRTLLGTQNIAWLSFSTLSNQSAFVPLVLSNIAALKPTGERIPKVLPHHGRVVVVGGQPLLEALSWPHRQPVLIVYGPPGSTHRLEWTTGLDGKAPWTLEREVTIPAGELSTWLEVPMAGQRSLFYRVVRKN
jgi:hypothetical protein